MYDVSRPKHFFALEMCSLAELSSMLDWRSLWANLYRYSIHTYTPHSTPSTPRLTGAAQHSDSALLRRQSRTRRAHHHLRQQAQHHHAGLATLSAQRRGAALHIRQALAPLSAAFFAAAHPIDRAIISRTMPAVYTDRRPAHYIELRPL